MKKLLIRTLIAIVLSIGLVTNSVNIAYADEKVAVPDYLCTPENFGRLYPNPDNSMTFYQCTPYGLVLMICPADLTFDVAANRCEHLLYTSDE
jgi:hypothetical protein